MNYNDIVTNAIQYADRENDAEVSARVDSFIAIVESRINRKLKVGGATRRSYIIGNPDTEWYGLPSDFNGLRDIEIKAGLDATTRNTAQYLNPEQMNSLSPNVVGPYYTLVANQIQIRPAPTDEQIIEIVYYRKLTNINSTNPTNWLTNAYPDAYIFGIITEIHAFTRDRDAAALWNERFKEVLDEIEIDDSASRWSGTPMTMRIG